jgi:hypothetical protein
MSGPTIFFEIFEIFTFNLCKNASSEISPPFFYENFAKLLWQKFNFAIISYFVKYKKIYFRIHTESYLDFKNKNLSYWQNAPKKFFEKTLLKIILILYWENFW